MAATVSRVDAPGVKGAVARGFGRRDPASATTKMVCTTVQIEATTANAARAYANAFVSVTTTPIQSTPSTELPTTAVPNIHLPFVGPFNTIQTVRRRQQMATNWLSSQLYGRFPVRRWTASMRCVSRKTTARRRVVVEMKDPSRRQNRPAFESLGVSA